MLVEVEVEVGLIGGGLLGAGGGISPVPVIEIPPAESTVDTGNVVGGSKPAVERCSDDALWEIQETIDGLSVTFIFSVKGQAKKAKVKGKASTNQNYTIRAWNGATWDDLTTIAVTTEDNQYSVNLAPIYTIDNRTQVRIFRAAGNNEILYLDCVSVYAIAQDPITDSNNDILLDSNSEILYEV